MKPMDDQDSEAIECKINRILDRLADLEPLEDDLGTPQLQIVDDLDVIITLGSRVISYLLDQVDRRPAKVVAYIVLILGQLGVEDAIEPVRVIRARYQALGDKDPWDYAVIGQCNLAIEHLQSIDP